MALSIAHLSFSSTGGAGTVASRLAEYQRTQGHDVWVHSLIPDSLWANPWQRPVHTLAAAVDHYVVKHPSFPASISLLRDRIETALPDRVREADVVHIHWPNGLVRLDTLGQLASSARVVWTLHDMNPFTAACHYAVDCRCYLPGDNPCQGVRRPFRRWATAQLQQKARFASRHSDVLFASPSAWLAGEAHASVVLGERHIPVIPNPLPASLPGAIDAPAWVGGASLGDGVIFVTSASQLSDPLKNIQGVIDAFEDAFDPQHAARLLVVGGGEAKSTHPGVLFLGRLSQQELWSVLAVADYMVVGSIAENQPLAVSEAQAMGASLLARNNTGLPEHLDIDADGDVFDTMSQLTDLLGQKGNRKRTAKSRATLAAKARKKFDPAAAAASYERLYRS